MKASKLSIETSKVSEYFQPNISQRPQSVIKRHSTFLHSEPIIYKILMINDDGRDCYGLEVRKLYPNIKVDGKVNSKAYTYRGGWLGGKNSSFSPINHYQLYQLCQHLGYGPHGDGRFAYINETNSQSKQDFFTTFDRGCFLLKHVPFASISDTGSISKNLDIAYHVSDQQVDDDKTGHNFPGKVWPVLTSSTCWSLSSNDTSNVTTPINTPRDRDIADSSCSNHETRYINRNEILKCYVNVFTNCVTIALYLSYELIDNIYVYVKGEYIQTKVQSPTIFSGKFDWNKRLLIAGSINGCTSKFGSLLLAMKSAKEEIKILNEMINMSSTQEYKCKDSIHEEAIINISDMAKQTRVFNTTIESHMKTVKKMLFYEDYKKVYSIASDYADDKSTISALKKSFISCFPPFSRQNKLSQIFKQFQFIQAIDKFNQLMKKHISNKGVKYQLIPPNNCTETAIRNELWLEIEVPTVSDMKARILKLQNFCQSTKIKG